VIKFSLVCDKDHGFDGWFSSSQDYETQKKRGLVTCPQCNSPKVNKSLMAPSVSTSRQKESMAVTSVNEAQRAVMAEMKQLRDKVIANSEDVGQKFPEEARKIHYGETEARAIYGEASRDDVESLLDEGVEIVPLPPVPEDAN
jgi:hypothetical protein